MAGVNLGIGKLDRRVQLQAKILAAANALGEQIASFVTYATVWGEKIELSGSQQLIAQQTASEIVTRYRIYWRSDVSVTNRIIVEGVTYELTYIAEIGRHDWLMLTAKALAA